MLILDKQLTIERMVVVASRPSVPAAFRRTAPPQEPVIEGVLVQTAAHAPQRRLAGVLVLAGTRSEAREALSPAIDAQERLATNTGVPYAPPMPLDEVHVVPELHLLPDTPSARHEPLSLLRRLARLLRATPKTPSTAPADGTSRPYTHLDAGRIHAWHARPVDVS